MIAILQGIADFISTLAGFITSFFSGFLSLFRYIGMAIQTVGVAIVYLPDDLKILALAFVMAAVMFLIIGR